MIRRIVVVGGFGVFGAAAVGRLRADGLRPLVASRREGADLRIDVEDRGSLRRLERGDVVVDTVGPFQDRSRKLLETACEVGFDVVDISDSLDYALGAIDMRARFEAAGIAVLTSCSSLSAISSAVVRLSGFGDPARVTAFLAPATRYAAHSGAGGSLLRSLGRKIRVFRDGGLRECVGWRERRDGAFLTESCDSVLLPRVWPTLRGAEFYVNTNVFGLDGVFTLAARWRWMRVLIEMAKGPGFAAARLLGSRVGRLAFEIESAGGRRFSCEFVAKDGGHVTAVVPAVIAARALAEGRREDVGWVPPDRHVDPVELVAYLESIGVRTTTR